jgi:hypothetical protein
MNAPEVVTSRVAELKAAIPAGSQGRITMGVAVVEDANGVRSVLISFPSGEPHIACHDRLFSGELLGRVRSCCDEVGSVMPPRSGSGVRQFDAGSEVV